MRQAEPNAAHLALARLEQIGRLRAVITQNIDVLHRRAGSRNVFELHGSLHSATCVMCFTSYPTDSLLKPFLEDGGLPQCPGCGGLLKPDVTLMGEQLPAAALRAARRAVRECDVLLVAGSSLEVMPAAGLPLEALNYGAHLIIVNLEPTFVDPRAAVCISADVIDVLPRLAEALATEAPA
jgi:NAD-dependent deacetylase